MTAEAQTQPKALADLVRTLQGTVTDQPMKLDYQEVCEARQAFIEEQTAKKRFRGKKIVTTVERAGPFYDAEEYHQDYHLKHGGSCPLPR